MKIGNLDLGEKAVLLAPMEDVTDASFRILCREAGADMVGKSSTLNEDVSEYFYKLIMRRKTSVEASGLTERELEILRLSAQGIYYSSDTTG